ncbi:MAG: dihydroorotate dehydrogenase [Candidatus Thermoplasmatota archaeon]|nr:dihydroorotate dehydrogenase [Candidatus Thermoplasmatota archaeon]
MADLSVEIAGLRLRNPVMLASGILGETGSSLVRVAEAGAGAVVTKSIGAEPREGYPNPTVVELEAGIINAVGLANPGIAAYVDELKVAAQAEVPVIGSVFGKSEGEMSEIASLMEEAGASAIELNLSCPHARNVGAELGKDPEIVGSVVSAVKKSVHIPVFAKITPNVTDIVDAALAVANSRGDGIVAINTVKAMAICPETGRPVLSNRIGGLSGPAIKPIGVRCVYELYESVDVPIIGVGGILTGKDALEYLMAGAKAVQIGSAAYYRGIEVFGRVVEEIGEFLDEYGYESVGDVVGIAHDEN